MRLPRRAPRGRSIRINTDPVADHYATGNERIIEFSSPNGGGLISFRLTGDGLTVEIYQTDSTVTVVNGGTKR